MKAFSRPVAWLLISLIGVLAGYSVAQTQTESDDELQKLLKARYYASIEEVKSQYEVNKRGASSPENLVDAGHRRMLAGLEISETKADKISMLTQYVNLTKDLEKAIEEKVSAGVEGNVTLHWARYARLDAEIKLLRAKRG
jgi:hypothetical protein